MRNRAPCTAARHPRATSRDKARCGGGRSPLWTRASIDNDLKVHAW